MKKYLLVIIFIIILSCSSVQAKCLKASAIDNFSTAKPANTFRIKTIESKEISKDIFIPANTLITGIVVDVKQPRRGKRDSNFELLPTSFLYNGKELEINDSKVMIQIKGYKPVDAKDLSFNVVRKVANFCLKGLISAFEFCQGAATAENGQRIKTGALNVYNDSFLVYVETGKELEIHPGDTIVIKIKKIH